jgi:hypothetical protein
MAENKKRVVRNMLSKHLDHLVFIDIYTERIKAFHLKDVSSIPVVGAVSTEAISAAAWPVSVVWRRSNRVLKAIFSKQTQYDQTG